MNTEMVAVKGHVRTAPDGDVTNNLSYHGGCEAGEYRNGSSERSCKNGAGWRCNE